MDQRLNSSNRTLLTTGEESFLELCLCSICDNSITGIPVFLFPNCCCSLICLLWCLIFQFVLDTVSEKLFIAVSRSRVEGLFIFCCHMPRGNGILRSCYCRFQVDISWPLKADRRLNRLCKAGLLWFILTLQGTVWSLSPKQAVVYQCPSPPPPPILEDFQKHNSFSQSPLLNGQAPPGKSGPEGWAPLSSFLSSLGCQPSNSLESHQLFDAFKMFVQPFDCLQWKSWSNSPSLLFTDNISPLFSSQDSCPDGIPVVPVSSVCSLLLDKAAYWGVGLCVYYGFLT